MDLVRGLALCETALIMRPVDKETADTVQAVIKDLNAMLMNKTGGL